MLGIRFLIILGIIILSLSVLALVSPRAFRFALGFLGNALLGILGLSIAAMLMSEFAVGVNLFSIIVCAVLGLPGLALLVIIGL